MLKPNLLPLSPSNRFVLLVLSLLLLHLLLWTTLTGVSHSAPDWDNMEELVWGSSIEWGYYKHPPLPSWIMYALIAVFGAPVWLTFFAGQLSVVLALFFIWKLGCEFSFQPSHQEKQNQYALIAVLLASLITYFTVRGIMNNHNTMQLWSIAGAIWMFYRATRRQRLLDWAWLGMFSSFAMLTKYSALIQFFCFFVYLIYTGQFKKKSTWQGMAIAGFIFFLLLTPHLFWLSQQTAGPLTYANRSLDTAMSRVAELITIREFSETNLGRIAPFLIGLGLVAFWNRNKFKGKLTSIASQLDSSDRFFILFMGLAPLIFTLLFALIVNSPLAAHWATTFFLLFGFFSWWWLADSPQLLKRTIIIVIVLQVISSIGFAIARGPVAQAMGRATRSTYPGVEVSQRLLSIWNNYNQVPLAVIASDTWTAGNVVIHAPNTIQVLIDGDYNKSPWIKSANLTCGMLVVIDRSADTTGNNNPPKKLVTLLESSHYHGRITLPWTKHANGPQIDLDWGVIPAAADCVAS